MDETTRYDVIMAGGGVMGCATAYYLLQADPAMKVAIVDDEGFGVTFVEQLRP